jgi:hypothetical protein
MPGDNRNATVMPEKKRESAKGKKDMFDFLAELDKM